jgi:hypothetical protein
MMMTKYEYIKSLSAQSPEEIAAGLAKVRNICPYCQSKLEYLITFTNGNGIRKIYSCNLCHELIFEDIGELE